MSRDPVCDTPPGPRLMCVGVDAADLWDLEPLYPSRRRPPYRIPWARLEQFTCRTCIPSTASHMSGDEGAEWMVLINVYRGSGRLFDAYQGWLLSRDATGEHAPRAIVARICDPFMLTVDEEARAHAAIPREADLYNSELASLQGGPVARFHGVFEASSAYDGMTLYVSVMEDCGGRATPEDEPWSFGLLSQEDK